VDPHVSSCENPLTANFTPFTGCMSFPAPSPLPFS
jgi:hypothetical protein